MATQGLSVKLRWHCPKSLRSKRHTVAALCFNAQVSSPVTLALRNLATKDHVPTVAIYETMPQGLHVQTWMLDEISAIEAAIRVVENGNSP